MSTESPGSAPRRVPSFERQGAKAPRRKEFLSLFLGAFASWRLGVVVPLNVLRAVAGRIGGPVIAVGVALAAGFGYIGTLAPTLLDGDAALFQYTPSVLGVTYPTGYPTYVLLGHLWQALVPLGEVAYRMNLFSAVCGALALALLYPALSRLLESRLAALSAVALFGTLPTYWRWATEAKIYTLHILLLSGLVYLITRPGTAHRVRRLVAIGLLLGLAAANHSTTVLLAPGLLLLLVVTARRVPGGGFRLLDLRYLLPAAALPLLLYTYIPLRAEALLAEGGTLPGLSVPAAVARGLVSEYYQPGLAGLVRYFTAADFTGGVVSNWGRVFYDLGSTYWPLLQAEFLPGELLLAGAGAIYWAARRGQRGQFAALFLIYAVLIPFVLTYGQGEQSAFLLPSHLVLTIFGGAAVAGLLRLIRACVARLGHRRRQARWSLTLLQVLPTMAVLAAVAVLPAQQAGRNIAWLAGKWNTATYDYWTDALAHPLEPDAGIIAHWGDLTSFWYLQHTHGLRSDLIGIYPPTEAAAGTWLAAGKGLYVAGPLQGWGDDLATHYRLIPWGRLVRVADRTADAQALLPPLQPPDPAGGAVTFGGRLRLLGFQHADTAVSGGRLPVTLAFEALAPMPGDTRMSLRLTRADGTMAGQFDDTLLSGWLPAGGQPVGQVMLSFSRFRIPAGTLPDVYRLGVSLYRKGAPDWTLPSGAPAYALGIVSVAPAPPDQPTDPWSEFKPAPDVVFGGQIRLAGYDTSVTRARQGRGFALRLLWQAVERPEADYTLRVELVDAAGTIWRDWHVLPAGGRAPTSTWQAGQTVRDEVPLVLPADAPVGEDALSLRLTWLRADSTPLPARRWLFPAGSTVTLPGVQIIEQEGRTFAVPDLQHATDANFDDQITLLGYDLAAAPAQLGDTLPLTLVWRSQTSRMRQSYAVFVHLVAADGRIVAQSDKEPGLRSKRPTTSWVQGEVIADPIALALPRDIAPGDYRLLVGLYEPPDGARLPLRDAAGAIVSDHLELTAVRVGVQ
jgi:hypothetical protein